MRVNHFAIVFSLLAILTYVVLLPIKNINATEDKDTTIKKTQALFDRTFADMAFAGYGLNHNMDIPEAILKLEKLIAQGANPNKKVSFGLEDDYSYLYTPISYIFFTCGDDFKTYTSDDKNFYLEIIQLLIDSGVDWNAKNSRHHYDDDDDDVYISTIAYTLKWIEEEKQHKPHCIEALNYVKNHLKENNITLEE